MNEQIPALGIRQPWAELILRRVKTIEIRSWSTDYRGALWLHTGLTGNAMLDEQFGLRDLHEGGYVGQVVLAAVVPLDARRWELWRPRHHNLEPYRPGMYGWVISSVRRFLDPVARPGQLNLFYPTPEIEAQLWRAELVQGCRESC